MIQSLIGIGATVIGSKLLSRLDSQHITVLHAIPGRIRLTCSEWKNEKAAKEVEEHLNKHSFVQRAIVSFVTGSLVIEFTKNTLTQDEFNEILQEAVNITQNTYPSRKAKAMSVMKNTFQHVDGLIKKKSKGVLDIHSLIVLLLLGKGFHGFQKNKAFSTSLFFWAYSILVNQKDKFDERK